MGNYTDIVTASLKKACAQLGKYATRSINKHLSVSAKDGVLKLVCTGSGESLTVTFRDTSLLDFEPVYVGCVLMSDITKSLTGSVSTLKLNEKSIGISSGKFKGSINLKNKPDDWLPISEHMLRQNLVASFKCTNGDFRKSLSVVKDNISLNSSDANKVMSMGYFEYKNDQVYAGLGCRFDSFAKIDLYVEEFTKYSEGDINFLLNKTQLQQAVDVIGDEDKDGVCLINIFDKSIRVTTEHYSYMTQVSNQKFMDWEGIEPEQTPGMIVNVEAKHLSELCSRVLPVCDVAKKTDLKVARVVMHSDRVTALTSGELGEVSDSVVSKISRKAGNLNYATFKCNPNSLQRIAKTLAKFSSVVEMIYFQPNKHVVLRAQGIKCLISVIAESEFDKYTPDPEDLEIQDVDEVTVDQDGEVPF